MRRIFPLVFSCFLGLSSLFVTVLSRASPYGSILSKMDDGIESYRVRRVAVLPFPGIDGRMTRGSKIVQERFTTALAEGKEVGVVERSALPQVLDEMALKHRGLLSESSSYELGKMLDADAVLTGTLTPLGRGRLQVNARLIRLPDGLILDAAEGLLKADWEEGVAEEAARREHLLGPLAEAFHAFQPPSRVVMERMGKVDFFRVGRRLYEAECTHCHGPDGRGIPVMAGILGAKAEALDLRGTDLSRYAASSLREALKLGKGKMPRHEKGLSQAEAAALLDYLRWLALPPASSRKAP